MHSDSLYDRRLNAEPLGHSAELAGGLRDFVAESSAGLLGFAAWLLCFMPVP